LIGVRLGAALTRCAAVTKLARLAACDRCWQCDGSSLLMVALIFLVGFACGDGMRAYISRRRRLRSSRI
jgi:hypothetical protein